MTIADRLAALSPEQRALFEKLRERQAPPAPRVPPPVRPVSGPLGLGDWPLSFDQERLWRLHQEDPRLISWNVDAGSYVSGDLDLPRFLAAIRGLIRRHAAWRTTFPVVEGRPVQRVVEYLEPALSLIDLAALPPELRERVGHQAIYDHTRAPVRSRGRAAAALRPRAAGAGGAPLPADDPSSRHRLDHLPDLLRRADPFTGAARRPAPRGGPAAAAGAVPGLRSLGTGVVPGRGAGRGGLLLAPGAGRLPARARPAVGPPAPAVQSQRGGLYRMRVGIERTERLRALARREGATPFMPCSPSSSPCSGASPRREKLLVGSNSANRMRPELAPVVGFFLTQVPFGGDLAGDPTFRELLAHGAGRRHSPPTRTRTSRSAS